VEEGFAKVIGLDLARLDLGDVEKLAEDLEKDLYEELEKRGFTRLDVQIGIDIRVREALLVAIDITVNSSVPLGPEVLAQLDEAIDRALARFEERLSADYSTKKP